MNKYKIILLAILSIFLTACDGSRDENTWVVGTSADNPPYEYMKNGEIVGFDIDLIVAIGQHLGKKVEFKNMEFHGLLAALSSENIDMAISGMSITPERTARVVFSVPYSSARIAILHHKSNKFQEPEDLKGLMSGAQLGTIWSLIAHDMSLKHGFRTKSLASNLMLVQDLKNKRLDAVIMEEAQASEFAKQNSALASFSVPQYGSSFAIAMPKNTKAKNNIDHTIKSFKSNGTLEALEKKWGLISAE